MRGGAALKLQTDYLQEMIMSHDFMGFTETCLSPQTELVAQPPPGYTLITVSRRPSAQHSHVFDNLVLEFDEFFYMLSYILPQGSAFEHFTDVHPFTAVTGIIQLLSENKKRVIWLGDLNARTGTRSSSPEFSRNSPNHVIDAQGSELLEFCLDANLVIMNGTMLDSAWPTPLVTFDNGRGGSFVVDCVIISRLMADSSISFRVIPEDGRDHHCLALDLPVKAAVKHTAQRGAPRRVDVQRPQPTLAQVSLDDKLCLLRASTCVPKSRCDKLYGPCYSSERATRVWTGGSFSYTNGGEVVSGMYWGEGARLNGAFVAPHADSDGAKQFAQLRAILLVLNAVSSTTPLVIYTPDEMIVHMLVHWAAKIFAGQYCCPHLPLMRSIITRLRAHLGTVELRVALPDMAVHANQALAELERAPSNRPPPVVPCPKTQFIGPALDCSKVYCSLKYVRAPDEWSAALPVRQATGHHALRAQAHARRGCWKRALSMACKQGYAEGWNMLRSIFRGHRAQALAPFDDVARDFEARISRPTVPLVSHNTAGIGYIHSIAENLPSSTHDM
ncbi:hypothetical protein DL93DRAFT_2174547 [Clavulina sp. PMI_390]|nr:hypothetical protein DL93DRAFT_2174547 [Clavulina sp. PMI_390]